MLIKGIFTDVEVNNQPPEFARHLKNVLLTEKLGTPINEPGFSVYVANGVIPYTVMGVKAIDEAILIFSTNTTDSEIGIVENGVYSTILNDTFLTAQTLGFATNAPADVEYHLNFNQERVVAWITDNNEPRILNIDNVSVQELNDIRMFPFSNPPLLVLETQSSGGGLEAGTHQISISYANRNGLETNWSALSRPVYVTTPSFSSGNRFDYGGVAPGTTTSKAILINLTEVDTRFELLRIAVVRTINNLITARFVKEVVISSTTMSTLYSGIEGTTEDMTLDEILVPTATYTNAKAIGQTNNKLYLGNLTLDPEVDLTDVALNTTLKWEAEGEQVGEDSNDPYSTTSFMPGEVMAFYLVGEKLNGSYTKGFHIPGRDEDINIPAINRAAGTADKDDSPAATTAKFTNTALNYEVDSTIALTTNPSGFTYTGEFGYWENTNEQYPASSSSTVIANYPAIIANIDTGEFTNVIRVDETTATAFGITPPDDFFTVAQNATQVFMASSANPAFGYYNQVVSTSYTSPNTFVDITLVDPTGNWDLYTINEGGFGTPGYTGLLVNITGVAVLKKGIQITVPLATPAAGIPSVGDSISLSNFPDNNNTYLVESTLTVSSTVINLFLSDGDIAASSLGSGTVSFEYIEFSTAAWPTGNVRHHRFPTLRALANLYNNILFPGTVGVGFMPRLTVKASNVILTAEQQLKIKRWFLVYAKRTPANATVMGQAPYQYAGVEENDYDTAPAGGIDKPFVPHVGNFVVGNTNNVPTGSGEQTGRNNAQRIPHQEVLKFTCFDLLVGKPSMGSLYIRQEVRYKDTQTFVTKVEADALTAEMGVYSNPVAANGVNLSRWVFINHASFSAETVVEDDYLREISAYIYTLPNTVDPTALGLQADLRVSEDSLWLKVRGGHYVMGAALISDGFTVLPPTGPDAGIPALDILVDYRMPGNNSASTGVTNGGSFLSSLCQFKNDVYLPFTEQSLVLTNNRVDSSITSGVFGGGDCKTDEIGIKQIAPYAAENPGDADPDKFKKIHSNPASVGAGLMGITKFPAYSVRTVGLRYLENSNVASIYYPKVNDFYNDIFAVSTASNYREILYTEDYTIANEYTSIGIFNPLDIPAATVLPHTIVSSAGQSLEERAISWQTFLAADRYVMPRNKGPITNIQGIGTDRLFIHQRDSLFITRSTTRIKGDIVDATLGSGDMFDVVPAEVLSTDEGFGGTQHKFACTLTKIGYVFPDVAQGKIFVHNGSQLDEISKMGQRIFWRDNISTTLADNPFSGEGITTTYDEKYNRLLVGVRAGIESFTASYSAVTKAWLGYHDYFPEYLIRTRKELYSLKNDSVTPNYGGIYKHNDTTLGAFGIYYNIIEANPTPYPMLVDIVYNPAPYDKKVFSATDWASEVIQANGVQAKDETIDYITIWNNTKTTGRVELERLVNLSQIHNANTRNVNDFWHFNGLRNIAVDGIPFRLDFYNDFAMIDANLNYNKSWYRKAPFIDRFVIARYEYSNLYNYYFSFLNHNISYRKSYR